MFLYKNISDVSNILSCPVSNKDIDTALFSSIHLRSHTFTVTM